MIEQKNSTIETGSSTMLDRIAQSILIGYAWVSGPALTEQQRLEQELAKAHILEMELESTSIVS